MENLKDIYVEDVKKTSRIRVVDDIQYPGRIYKEDYLNMKELEESLLANVKRIKR